MSFTIFKNEMNIRSDGINVFHYIPRKSTGVICIARIYYDTCAACNHVNACMHAFCLECSSIN